MKSVIVAAIGFDNGKIMWKKIRLSPAPSMRAASVLVWQSSHVLSSKEYW